MARLPDVQSLGQRPEPRAQRPIFAVQDPGIAERAEAESSKDLIQVADRLAAAGERIIQREEAVQGLNAIRTYREKSGALERDFLAQGNISDPNAVKNFNKSLEDLENQTIGSLGVREESRIRISGQIQGLRIGAVDRVALASVKAQHENASNEIKENLNQLAVDVRSNPGQVINTVRQFEQIVDALPLNDDIKRVQKREGRGFLYETAISRMIDAGLISGVPGAMNDAWDFLQNPEVSGSLGPERQDRIFTRMSKISQTGRILTPQETAQMGFPDGVVVQRKANGDFDVVFKPEKDAGVRDQKINDLYNRFTGQGMDQQAAMNKAVDIVDGNLKIEVVPGLGVVREVNVTTGQAREVPLDPGQQVVAAAPQGPTLWQLAESGNIAGVLPAVGELAGRTAGQIPMIPTPDQLMQDRQEIRVAQNELIRALSINPRFPASEIKRIREEVEIEPAAMDSTRALLSRMKGIDRQLRIRLANEEAAAANVNLPQEARGNASQAAKDIRAFLNRMGVPQETKTPSGIPPGSKMIGKTKAGREVWQSPDGRKLVIE